MAVFLLYFLGVAMLLGCSSYKDYKTLTNDKIDGYFLETREYRELPFKSSVIYPVSENLYFFKEFMKPFRNGLFLESTHFFKLGIYDSEKNQVVARWFDNRTSYDPYDPKFVPKINIADQYKIKPLNE